MGLFDPNWWREVCLSLDPEDLSAIDSLKTLRDKIAHGKPNGTGFVTIRNYCGGAKRFAKRLPEIVLT
ncbi:hypothetical protein [Palleronia salina]|uniref:hypothetical protein n=1 Tax=Palleronia salina TaxID=313368 RepID=UPI003570E5DB